MIHEYQVKVKAIGRRASLPEDVQEAITKGALNGGEMKKISFLILRNALRKLRREKKSSEKK